MSSCVGSLSDAKSLPPPLDGLLSPTALGCYAADIYAWLASMLGCSGVEFSGSGC